MDTIFSLEQDVVLSYFQYVEEIILNLVFTTCAHTIGILLHDKFTTAQLPDLFFSMDECDAS